MNNEFLYKDECYKIQGAIFEVAHVLGAGFLENVYQEALEYELAIRDIPFSAQSLVEINYKNHILNQTYKIDLICYGKIIVELKAVKELCKDHESQVLNYLKATGYKVGLLVNFGAGAKAEIMRFVR